VLGTPKIVPVFFTGDADADTLGKFLTALPASSYWKEVSATYGVGATTVAAPIVVSDTPAPTSIADAEVKTWLAAHLDGSHADWGSPDASAIYAIFYPATTTFTIQGATSCKSIGAYHSTTKVGATNATYGVIGRCTSFAGMTGLDVVTAGASHELVEAATDPLNDANQGAYTIVDDDHFVWEVAPGAEVVDMCDNFSGVYVKPPDLGFMVERVWSNAAAAAGHHPCIPAVAGEVYFNAVPKLDESVSFLAGAEQATKGVTVPLGKSKTIDVALLSDGPTGAFTVEAKTLLETTPSLAFAWDRASGKNGDVLKLTITRKANGDFGGTVVQLDSKLGAKKNIWMAFVAN
jgi:hypothetical protein